MNGFINFVIPLLFYICALRRYGGYEPVGREQILSGLRDDANKHSMDINRTDSEPVGSRRSFDVSLLKLHVDSIQERAPTRLDSSTDGSHNSFFSGGLSPYRGEGGDEEEDEESEEQLLLKADPTLLARIEADLRFRSVPKFVTRWIKPVWIAGFLSVLITLGIVATIVMDIVYLAQGDDVVG